MVLQISGSYLVTIWLQESVTLIELSPHCIFSVESSFKIPVIIEMLFILKIGNKSLYKLKIFSKHKWTFIRRWTHTSGRWLNESKIHFCNRSLPYVESNKMPRVQCKHCGQDLAKAVNRLNTHLTTCDNFAENVQTSATSGSTMNTFVDSMPRNDNELCQAVLARCIIKCALPFKV